MNRTQAIAVVREYASDYGMAVDRAGEFHISLEDATAIVDNLVESRSLEPPMAAVMRSTAHDLDCYFWARWDHEKLKQQEGRLVMLLQKKRAVVNEKGAEVEKRATNILS